MQTALSDGVDLVLRHGQKVDYLSAGAAINPIPDCENGCGYYSSLKNFGTEDGGFRQTWEIYKFSDLSYKKDLSALPPGCATFLLREENGDGDNKVKV